MLFEIVIVLYLGALLIPPILARPTLIQVGQDYPRGLLQFFFPKFTRSAELASRPGHPNFYSKYTRLFRK